MNKLISIIIPIYNTNREFIKRAVDSVINQRYKDFELLIIDDGSKPEIASFCDSIATDDSRIKVYHIPNGGVSKARNFGLDKSSGEFITFLDGDDFISPQCLEHLIEAQNKTNAFYVKCGAKRIYTEECLVMNSEGVVSYKEVDTSTAIDDICYLKRPYPNIEITSVWGTLYSREAIESIRFREDVSIGEDFIFNVEVIERLDKVVYVADSDYGYYINSEGAMCGKVSKKKIDSVKGFISFLTTHSSLYDEDITNRLVNIAIVILLMIPIQNEYKKNRDFIISFIKKYRWNIIKCTQTRKKVRLSLLLSYLSFNFMQRIYSKVEIKRGYNSK